jgi:NAD(P)H-dependent flavin oxidoreductase YrpB (nitropropane dioxygenase family)
MSTIRTVLCDMLDIKYPIIQAAMGPFCTNKLAVAVSNEGALGTISITQMTSDPEVAGEKTRENINFVKQRTKNTFAVNTPIGKLIEPMANRIMEVVIEEREKDPRLKRQLKVFITSAGDPTPYTKKLHDAGLLHFHVAPSVYHAKKTEKAGADAVIASGFEAGGHTHSKPVHTLVLVPEVAKSVKIPVIAAGGFCNAEGFVAALAAGAVGIQMGTRFIATQECDFHPKYKEAIVKAGEWDTTVVPGVLGPARVLRNKLIEEFEKRGASGIPEWELAKLKDLALVRAMEEGDIEHGALPAGMVAGSIHEILTVKEVIEGIMQGAQRILERLEK